MKAFYTTGHKVLLLSLMLLLTAIAWGQDHVRLINGAGYLSEAAVSAASGRLSTELPNHDVHITYVNTFVDISDRYSVYDSLGLMPFTQVPNSTEGFPPATQEEKDAAINAAIHEAMTTVSSDNNTIHIIYATAVSLNTQAEEEVLSRKFLHFGSNVKRIDEMKVKQIVPSPELEVLSDSLQNDQYLADYVDELIAALNDPNYVINGSVEYDGNIYFSGDTIFYFHPTDELINTQVAEIQKVKLLINPNYPVSPISWTELEPITLAGAIISSNSPFTDANLTLKRDHFSGISKLQASYGTATTAVWFYPVNLQLELSNEAIVETHSINPPEPDDFIEATLTNNGFAWPNHPSIYLQLSLAKPATNGMSIFSTNPFPAGTAPEYTWEWTEEVCKTLRFIATAQRPVSGVMSDRIKEIRVKCEFEIAHINIYGGQDDDNNASNADVINPLRKVQEGDTLYIVSKNNDLNRELFYEVEWVQPAPTEDDFWENAPNSIGPEPVWYFGSPGLNSWDVIKTPTNYHRLTSFMATYGSEAFPYSITGDPNYFTAGIRAFNDHRYAHLTFLRENRKTYNLTLPDWLVGVESWFNNYFSTFVDKVTDFLPGPFDVGFSLDTQAGRTDFFTEDSESPGYIVNREEAIGLTLGLSGNATWDLAPGPWITIGPFIDIGGSVGVAYELGKARLYNEPEFEITAHTIEVPFTVEVALGAIIALNLHDQDTTGISLSAQASGNWPMEAKGKIQNNVGQLESTCLIFEANGGPASLNIAVGLSAQFDWGAIDIDMDIFSYSWSYPFTDKYFMDPKVIKLWGPDECE